MFKFIYSPPSFKNWLVKEPKTIPPTLVLKVTHFRQRYKWDCGLSCVIMTLSQDTRREFLDNFSAICLQEGFNSSTRTIDLCYLLKRFNMRHLYCTVYLGVRDEIKELQYYREMLDADRDRVTERLQRAHGNGITVKKYSLTTEEMLQHLSANGPIIVSVDANRLHRHDGCALKTILRHCLPASAKSYVGHYVLVCGYSLADDKLYYKDPGRVSRLYSVGFDVFDKARKCFGTGEDTILIFSNSDMKKLKL